MTELLVDIWSDIACPWCYVGKRRFESALADFPHRDAVRVRWHAFELDPTAPPIKEPNIPYAERLAQKYATSVVQAEGMIQNMTATAAAEGLDLRFERIRPGNTFDAHRLIRHAADAAQIDALEERFFRAYLTEGEPIGDRGVLSRLAGEIGLDPAEVREVLRSDAHADAVRADEATARQFGITAVPAFVIAERELLTGAQPTAILLEALDRAWRFA